MIKRLVGCLRRKDLEINVDKTKIMSFRKAGGRTKDVEIKINGKGSIEIVKKFRYLVDDIRENTKKITK